MTPRRLKSTFSVLPRAAAVSAGVGTRTPLLRSRIAANPPPEDPERAVVPRRRPMDEEESLSPTLSVLCPVLPRMVPPTELSSAALPLILLRLRDLVLLALLDRCSAPPDAAPALFSFWSVPLPRLLERKPAGCLLSRGTPGLVYFLPRDAGGVSSSPGLVSAVGFPTPLCSAQAFGDTSIRRIAADITGSTTSRVGAASPTAVIVLYAISRASH